MTTEPTVEPTPDLPPHKVAFILDGAVQDVLHTDARLAAILLSNPVILDVSSYYEGEGNGFSVVQWFHTEEDNTISRVKLDTP